MKFAYEVGPRDFGSTGGTPVDFKARIRDKVFVLSSADEYGISLPGLAYEIKSSFCLRRTNMGFPCQATRAGVHLAKQLK